MKTDKWLKIDKDNLPKGEVVAACFDETSRFYGGKFWGEIEVRGGVSPYCEGVPVTHYIPLPNDEDREI